MIVETKFISRFFIIFGITFLAALPAVFGQNPGGGLGGDPGATPIDGGLSLLLAAGASYGAKKLYDRRKKKSDESEN